MKQRTPPPPTGLPPQHRFLPLLLILFVGSGCSALIYEIVWFQLLELVIGSSAVSLGVLLGTFMGGMCLGSLLLPRLISSRRHPLRVYALIELGIGIFGLLILLGMPFIDRTYASIAGHGLANLLLRGGVCALCLLPPTILMGATLPAIARWVESTPQGLAWLGFFYGGNIAGAVFGCLLAGFYLLRVYDMPTATYVAASINAAVAVLGLALSTLAKHAPPSDRPANSAATPTQRNWPAYLAIALSGLSALGAEVIWTRLLSLMLGATVYTFSIILAVFLIGLGLGSSIGAALARGTMKPRTVLGVCQFFLAAAIAYAAYMLARSLPYWPLDPSISRSPWINFQLDLLRCAWAILPAALLWGASFPAALAMAGAGRSDPGKAVGGVYAANTIGAILGAIAFSILIIPNPKFGTQGAQRVLIAAAALATAVVFVPSFRRRRDAETAPASMRVSALRPFGALALLGTLAVCTLLACTIPPTPWQLIAYGRYVPAKLAQPDATLLYVGEGMNSSVAVTLSNSGERNFHVSGKIEASSGHQDMRLQRMLGHIPALLHPKPQSVLVVGCGAGVTAGSFLAHPDVRRVVICEIEPLIPQVVATHFAAENYGVVKDKRVQIVYDDARHYILTTHEKFDIITSDPIHPWVRGAATLYTQEYFQHCREHLNPDGVITQWVPLYESDADAVKSELRTFFEVFPDGAIFSNDAVGRGYDTLLLGRRDPKVIDLDELQKRFARDDHQFVALSLEEVGFHSLMELITTYAGRARDLAPWLADAQVNHDRDLRLQYLAGMGLNSYRNEDIYDQIVRYRSFPVGLFSASKETWQNFQLGWLKTELQKIKGE